MLYLILQRYWIESNSQLWCTCVAAVCVVSNTAKILNWKQFTTGSAMNSPLPIVVSNTAKILNWKQFTTLSLTISPRHRLYLILQRYWIESNSQPGVQWTLPYPLLYLILQRYWIESNSQLFHWPYLHGTGCI